MEQQSKLVDLRLISKFFPVSNYSYPRPNTPSYPRDEMRGRVSLGSNESVPGMVEDHGSDISAEDEYLYHTTAAELWDSFWKAKPQERLSRMRSYPALIRLPNIQQKHQPQAQNQQPNQKQQQDQQQPDRHRPQRSLDSSSQGQDVPAWPLPSSEEKKQPQRPAASRRKTSWTLFPQTVPDSSTAPTTPRSSSLPHQGTPSTPTQAPGGALSRPFLRARASKSNLASPPAPIVPTPPALPAMSLSPAPSEPATPAQPSQPPRMSKRRRSLANLRKLSLGRTSEPIPACPPPASAAHIDSLSDQQSRQQQQRKQPQPHFQCHSQLYLEPTSTSTPPTPVAPYPSSDPRSATPVPTTTPIQIVQIPLASPTLPLPSAPPIPAAPQVSVFEYDSDLDGDGASTADDEDGHRRRSSSSSFARRIVRGIAGHRGRDRDKEKEKAATPKSPFAFASASRPSQETQRQLQPPMPLRQVGRFNSTPNQHFQHHQHQVHAHHYNNNNHQHLHHHHHLYAAPPVAVPATNYGPPPRPRSASDAPGAAVDEKDGETQKEQPPRVIRRQRSEVFGRMLGRKSR